MKDTRPNILFIMSDDHASHAMSCYGSRINKTPQIDRIAKEGMRFNRCFCTNSICGPSRATILTGTHNHINGVTTLTTKLDRNHLTFPKLLQKTGYQTAMIGKWHLGNESDPGNTGFDYFNVLPGQGDYIDPIFWNMGAKTQYPGYVTDIIGDLCLDWLKKRDQNRPFLLKCHHKAPHRPWIPNPKYATLFEDGDIPEPDTFNDDYQNRAKAASIARMTIARDLKEEDVKGKPPTGLTPEQEKKWYYQRYIKDYLRCVASIDENVGRLLDYLDQEGLTENTIVIYTSDQGFFLGDHGWYDKRFMYEESLQMPFIIRYPPEIKPGGINDKIITNVDFAPTFLDYAQVQTPKEFQGTSFRSLLKGESPSGWQTSLYYRYWMHLAHHHVTAHYGVRTENYKLIYYYGKALGQLGAIDENTEPEWELFDLKKDPREMMNVYHNPAYADIRKKLTQELGDLQKKFGDTPDPAQKP